MKLHKRHCCPTWAPRKINMEHAKVSYARDVYWRFFVEISMFSEYVGCSKWSNLSVPNLKDHGATGKRQASSPQGC